jgi:carboxyl-terminal processing protease
MLGRKLSIVVCLLGLCLFAQGLTARPAHAEPRVALVIGNSHYAPEIGALPNPANDANLIAQALQQTGFQVIKVVDVDQKKMKRAIADFGDKLAAAGADATGLFFYAGHGVQVRGTNYLVPLGADIDKEADVDIESVSADTVIQQMEFANNRVNIIILDACRNNPMARSMRSVQRGLAPMDASQAAQGTFVAYSTAPGQVAADGTGKDSPYSIALAKIIVQPGIGIEEVFRNVRAEVMGATDKKQIPWDSSSLTAPFYFKGGSAVAAQPIAPSQPAATPANSQLDSQYWTAISNSKKPGDYQGYLKQFPNGTFAPLARSRLADLGASQVPATITTPPTPVVRVAQPQPAAVPPVEEDTTDDADDDAPMQYADTVDRGGKRKDRNKKSHNSHGH